MVQPRPIPLECTLVGPAAPGGQDCHSAEHVIGRKCHSGGKPPNTALERRRRTGRRQEQGPPLTPPYREPARGRKEKIEIIPRSPTERGPRSAEQRAIRIAGGAVQRPDEAPPPVPRCHDGYHPEQEQDREKRAREMSERRALPGDHQEGQLMPAGPPDHGKQKRPAPPSGAMLRHSPSQPTGPNRPKNCHISLPET